MSVFSPLALTQALPFLPLAQGDIDYEVSRRDEPDLFDTALLEPDTKVILVKDGMVAVPRGQGAIADYANVHMRLAQLPGAYVAAELHTHPTALAIFLGSYGGKRDEHVVAVDVSRVKAAETVAASSEHMGADDAFGEQHEPEAKTSKSLLESAAERFDWVDLRGFAPHASAREAGQATTAISLGVWHARQRHCPTCGAPTEPALGGWAQRCASEADGKRLLFPRVEPAVITAIVDHEDRLLLQHNSAWRNTGLYSVSAGFVEAGENLEHACRREAKEEVGIDIGELKYLGSQPWPFPRIAHDGVQRRGQHHRRARGRRRDPAGALGDPRRIHERVGGRAYGSSREGHHSPLYDRRVARSRPPVTSFGTALGKYIRLT